MNKTLVFLLLMTVLTTAAYSRGNKEEPEKKQVPVFENAKQDRALPAETKTEDEGEMQQFADWNTAVNGDIVTVEGRIRLVGNEPFSELVIVDAEGQQWYLDDEGRKAAGKYEQRVIAVRGTVERKKMRLANGKELPDKVFLQGIEIVE